MVALITQRPVVRSTPRPRILSRFDTTREGEVLGSRVETVSGSLYSLISPKYSLFASKLFRQQFQLNEFDSGNSVEILVPKQTNSLYFSLFAGNSGGEGLARDCALRHSVWIAENFVSVILEIFEIRRISSNLAAELDWRESSGIDNKENFGAFSPEGISAVQLPRSSLANGMRSQIDLMAKAI